MKQLPTIDSPTYTKTLPISKQKVDFRPFKVREQRLFAEALTGDDYVLGSTIKEIVNNCTGGKLDFNNLHAAEIEWLYLQLRAKSIGEKLDLSFKCSNVVDGEVCNTKNLTEVDIENIEITLPAGS